MDTRTDILLLYDKLIKPIVWIFRAAHAKC